MDSDLIKGLVAAAGILIGYWIGLLRGREQVRRVYRKAFRKGE